MSGDQPTQKDAENAVVTLLKYLGEDPEREGLKETPKRFVKAYQEMLKGYREEPEKILSKTFEDIDYENELVLVKGIRLVSFCEHHILPIIGKAHVAYIPDKKLLGISKLARLVDVFSARLQTQEILTKQILDSIEKFLKPKGVAVMISSAHFCLSIRGAQKPDSETVTQQFAGVFKKNPHMKDQFYRLIDMR